MQLVLEGWGMMLTQIENVLHLLNESFFSDMFANYGFLTIYEQNETSTNMVFLLCANPSSPFHYFTDLEWFIVMRTPDSMKVTICFPYSSTGKVRVLNSVTVF